MPLVEKRYAEALINVSSQENAMDAFGQELQLAATAFEQNQDLKFLLLNPGIGTTVKKEVVRSIFIGSISYKLLNFLMLLLDKGRIKHLPGILEEYVRLADQKKNVLSITVISAAPIDPQQLDKVKEKFKKIYNASSVKADFKVNRDLTGGVVVKVGDKVIDGSIKGRLESMRRMLITWGDGNVIKA